MDSNEIVNHVQKCLEMSSGNKITPKNAFALQLIDCMNVLMNKTDFSIMACTLDAGAKIYSNRVDALHMQVLKLADEIVLHRKNGNTRGNELNNNDDMTKEQRKFKKRNIIASTERLRKELKGKDPRDKFIKLDGVPGETITACKILGEDMSISIENNLKFWTDFERRDPVKANGLTTLPEFKINRGEKSEVYSFNKHCVTDVCIEDILQSSNNTVIQHLELEYEVHEDIGIQLAINKESEVDVISTAMKKLNEEAEKTGSIHDAPSRFETMKLIFKLSSDYDYFDMNNAHYWAGPEFWKRSKAAVNIGNNGVMRKKKEPRKIIYSTSKTKDKEVIKSRKRTFFTKRTISSWASNKITLPRNHNYKEDLFLNLFNISFTSDNNQVNYSMETNSESNNEAFEHVVGYQETSYKMESQHSFETTFYVGVYEDQLGVSESSEDKDPLNSAFYDKGLIRQLENLREPNINTNPSKFHMVEIGLTENLNNCELTLVPAPKILRIEPIKTISKPNRIDMQHLKSIMLRTITRDIEVARDNKSFTERSPPEVGFRNILRKLPDRLERRTAEDLTPAMALMALLTLANENNLLLMNSEADDVIVRMEESSSKDRFIDFKTVADMRFFKVPADFECYK